MGAANVSQTRGDLARSHSSFSQTGIAPGLQADDPSYFPDVYPGDMESVNEYLSKKTGETTADDESERFVPDLVARPPLILLRKLVAEFIGRGFTQGSCCDSESKETAKRYPKSRAENKMDNRKLVGCKACPNKYARPQGYSTILYSRTTSNMYHNFLIPVSSRTALTAMCAS